MAGLYVGVDVGTQGAKAVVYDAKTKSVVSRGAHKYDIIKTNVPGRAEQHPSLWIEVDNIHYPNLTFLHEIIGIQELTAGKLCLCCTRYLNGFATWNAAP